MSASVQGLIDFIKSQPEDRLTSSGLWDPCVIADYVRERVGVDVPRRSDSKELTPFLEELKLDRDFGRVADILNKAYIPDTYGNLLTYVVYEFPRAALLLQTKATA